METLDEIILGKPADQAEAEAMLEILSGRTHLVITAFCLRGPSVDPPVVDHVVTEVEFRVLCSEEIKQYAASGEPMDKAGAYAIQGRGGFLTGDIKGSYTNVVGLPLSEVLGILKGHGIL